MGEVMSFVDEYDLYASSPEIICCRICHEVEFETSKTLEAPCSCSGTLKFAHRDCIQRWCNEKGNTRCEICLQKFEPGYSAPPPSKPKPVQLQLQVQVQLIQEVSLEVPPAQEETLESSSSATASICRSLALILLEMLLVNECFLYLGCLVLIRKKISMQVTLLLLVRHSIEVLIGGTGDYPFTLFTLLVMRASGIVVPIYIIMRTVDAIHNSITHSYQVSENNMLRQNDSETWQHRVDIE
ncbi:hypothetical protein OSB04_022895 [Centaurea solstitialis]|uniref:RING-CH-type domain-containing protein n=1 Tax=Centaurea solstitialis TaxID=347529 RepID=A0AA38T2U1_9ASTR|nr:hypothetical protein OSB04_022895 [Centaurea solstitialis]